MTERRTGPSWRADLRPIAPLAVLWLAGSTFLFALVRQEAIPYEDLLLDPTEYGGRPWYSGLISNLGVLGWTTAVVAAAGGGWLAALGSRRGASEMLRGGALLSGLFLLDDLFQFHIIVPRTIGAPKASFYLLYALLAGAWANGNRREFLRTRWHLLGAAVAALGASVLIDLFGNDRSTHLLAEDSAKFLGILAWALYFVLSTSDIARSLAARPVRPALDPRAEAPALLAFEPGGATDDDDALDDQQGDGDTLVTSPHRLTVPPAARQPLRAVLDTVADWSRRNTAFWTALVLLVGLFFMAAKAILST